MEEVAPQRLNTDVEDLHCVCEHDCYFLSSKQLERHKPNICVLRNLLNIEHNHGITLTSCLSLEQ